MPTNDNSTKGVHKPRNASQKDAIKGFHTAFGLKDDTAQDDEKGHDETDAYDTGDHSEYSSSK